MNQIAPDVKRPNKSKRTGGASPRSFAARSFK
jgi:hypothetical protein